MIFEAREAALIAEHNQRAWAVWHIAALTRGKKMPPLRKLMVKPRQREPQTWQQQLAIVQAWTSAAGGTVVKKDD